MFEEAEGWSQKAGGWGKLRTGKKKNEKEAILAKRETFNRKCSPLLHNIPPSSKTHFQ